MGAAPNGTVGLCGVRVRTDNDVGELLRAPSSTNRLNEPPGDVAGVATVIDGDTIEVHGQRIRY